MRGEGVRTELTDRCERGRRGQRLVGIEHRQFFQLRPGGSDRLRTQREERFGGGRRDLAFLGQERLQARRGVDGARIAERSGSRRYDHAVAIAQQLEQPLAILVAAEEAEIAGTARAEGGNGSDDGLDRLAPALGFLARERVFGFHAALLQRLNDFGANGGIAVSERE